MDCVYYCQKYDLETRLFQSTKLIKKYPNRVPIIVQPLPGSPVPWVNKFKFLVPKTSPCSSIQCTIREEIVLDAEYALNYLVDVTPSNSIKKQFQMLNGAELIGSVYLQFVKTDGFCYVYYDQEHCFG